MQNAFDAIILVTVLAGSNTFKALCSNACFIAITSNTKNVSQFMLGRGDSDEKIARRITRTQLAKESKAFNAIAFDAVIENKPWHLDAAIDRFVAVVESYLTVVT